MRISFESLKYLTSIPGANTLAISKSISNLNYKRYQMKLTQAILLLLVGKLEYNQIAMDIEYNLEP